MPGPLGGKTTIGRMRHRLRIEKLPDAGLRERSKYGNEKGLWSEYKAAVWGEVLALSGRELFSSGQVQAEVSHKVTMRHRTDLAAIDRLVWLDGGGNAVLNIVAILPSEGRANCIDVWCLQEM